MRSIRAEWSVLGRRPAVRVLWVIATLSVAVLIYGVLYLGVHNPSASDQPSGLAQARLSLQPSSFLWTVSRNLGMFYNVLALVLGALAYGSDYGWHTWKTLFTQGPGRLEVYAARFGAVTVTVVGLVISMFLIAAVCSWVAAQADGAPVRWPAITEITKAIGSATLILLMWAAMGSVLAVALKQAAFPIGLGAAYATAELILSGSMGDEAKAGPLARSLPGVNATALAESFRPSQFPGTGMATLDAGQAALTLVMYICAFAVVGALLTCYRDVA